MFNEYWQARNYAKLLKRTGSAPCLPVFCSEFFSSLHCSPFITFDLLLNAFQYVHVCCPMKPRNGCSCICFMCSHPQWWRGEGSPLLWVILCSSGYHCARKGTLLTYSTWCPLRLPDTSLPSCFPDSFPHSLYILVSGFVLFPMQGFAIPMIQFQDVPISPFLQPVEESPDALPPVCHQPTCWELCWAGLYAVLTAVVHH